MRTIEIPQQIQNMIAAGALVVLNAADFGVPQSRIRLFVVATRGQPLTLTHPALRHVPASTILDWDAGIWSPIKKNGRAVDTLARIRRGRAQYGDRFLLAYYGREVGGRSTAKPLGTVRTNDCFALIQGDQMRMLSIREARRAQGFRDDYVLPVTHKDAMKMLGNAIPPPLMAGICAQLMAAV